MRRWLAFLVPLVMLSSCTRATERPPSPSVEDAPEPGPDPASEPAPAAVAPAPPAEDEPDDRGIRLLPNGAPAAKYVTLDRAACEAELRRRKVPFVRAAWTQGVAIPVRLEGPISGVAIHSRVPPWQRRRSKYEIFDCRLVVALDDFARILAKHDVVDVIHYAAYRPKSENGCTKKYTGKQHCAALALDVGIFEKKDGTKIDVLAHFHGKIGAPTCTAGSGPSRVTEESTMLWNVVCEAAQKGIFNVILTPNYNAQHANHFHVEITPDAEWQMIR